MKTKKYMLMLAAVVALAACTNDDTPLATATDALADMNPETRIGISAELGGEFTASRNTTTETEAVYASRELHGTKDDVTFFLDLPGGVKTQLLPTDENGAHTYIAFNELAEKLPLYLKDFNLTEGNGRCVSRWTILNTECLGWDRSYGWARLTADEATGQPKLSYTLQRGDAKVTLKVVDAAGNAINMKGITAAFNTTGTVVTPIYTGAGDPTNGYPALKDYLSIITTLAADDAVDADKIKLAVYASGYSGFNYFSSLVDAAGEDLAADHNYSRANGYMSAIVQATPTHTVNDNNACTPITNPAFADTDMITITVPDNYSGLDDNQVGGTYKLKFADIAAGDDVPAEQKTAEDKLKYLAPGDHLTVTVTLTHNSVASATATLGSWTEVGANGGAAAGGDDASKHIYTINAADMSADAVQAAVANALDAGVRELSIEGDLTAAQLGAVGNAIRAFEESKTGPNAGTVSLAMPDQTTIPEEAFQDCHALTAITLAEGTKIGQLAFVGCSNLATVEGTLSGTIGSFAFRSCTALTEITLGDGVSIGQYAFDNCYSMTSLTLEGVVTEVGAGAFYNVGSGNCALTLASGQKEMKYDSGKYVTTDTDVTASETSASWAGNTWASITINTNE